MAAAGMDGRRSEERIADVIAKLGGDLIGLQELNLNRRRSSGVDQPALIADQLGWHRYFHPAFRVEDEHYGNGILTHVKQIRKNYCSIVQKQSSAWQKKDPPRHALCCFFN